MTSALATSQYILLYRFDVWKLHLGYSVDMVTDLQISASDAQHSSGFRHEYLLITAAHNEEKFIEGTIKSVISQTWLPKKWIIASDASTDSTEKIVERYASEFDFIELVCIQKNHARSFASKVYALNAGLEKIDLRECKFIGVLDADISFEKSYFANLIAQFESDPNLGLAGGFIYEERYGNFRTRSGNSIRSVAGAIQLFRRECYESIGGILPLRYGGEDWCAEVMARMNGWQVRAIPQLKVFHHKPTGTGAGVLKYWYHQGFMDHSLGSHPLFATIKCIKRLRAKPYVVGALARLAGFVCAYLRKEARPVPKEFVNYLRMEQKNRLPSPLQVFF